MIDIYLKGFIITFSLIVAIGAQNAYILKLGLLKRYVLIAVSLCTFFDFILISLGVLGLGFFIKGNQLLINIIAIIGIVFLLYYSLLSFRSILKNNYLNVQNSNEKPTLKQTILPLLAFTFLNPHAYLDTILLIGAVGANYNDFDEKLIFLAGAICASGVWFFSLGFAARFLIPLFRKNITWKILDFIIGIIMLIIAYSLIDLIKM